MALAIVMSQSSILHMAITSISKLTPTWSPDVFIHGIPWKILVCKQDAENSLAIYLHCAKEDESSQWTVSARATIKLMAFGQKKTTHDLHISPCVFDASKHLIGCSSFIPWDDLMHAENQYVKNDKIQLKIKITAEDPNYVDRSILKFETVDKSCDCGSHATFRLLVTNIENLLAVRSPQFTVRGLAWDLSVYKWHTSMLGIMLTAKEASPAVSCQLKMTVKLLSSKNGVAPMKKSIENRVGQLGNIRIEDMISWDNVIESTSGFVKNNSITLEVKVKVTEPGGDAATGGGPKNPVAKRRRLECSICLEDLDNQDISTTTPCGHLFCTVCITKAIKDCDACPMCKKAIENLQRIYLPM